MKKLCFTLIIFMFSLCIKGSYVYDEDDIYKGTQCGRLL